MKIAGWIVVVGIFLCVSLVIGLTLRQRVTALEERVELTRKRVAFLEQDLEETREKHNELIKALDKALNTKPYGY
jgi:chaperonin cofactor prefoldin